MSFLLNQPANLHPRPDAAGALNPMPLLAALTLLLILAACNPAASTPTEAPTLTQAPISTQAPTSTDTPVAPMATATLIPTPVNWDLIWSDEFNNPDGSGIDESKWMPSDTAAWVNGELEYYTPRIQNVYIENPTEKNGMLVLKALKEDYGGREYTSGKLTTMGKFEQLYGRFEALIQIPYGQGLWPAFWMLGVGGGWPLSGEIDIFENIGKEPNIVHGTMHGPGYSGANGIGGPFALPGGERFADGFHLFAVEWEPNVIRWYVDNQLYKTNTPADLPEGAEWVYNHPFYIILNVAVGGGWPGFPDETTVFPQTMKVDYVRVYARPGGWPTSTPT